MAEVKRQNLVSSENGSTVSLIAANARIQELEEKYDLLRYTLDGWSVWPLLRFLVSRQLSDMPFVMTEGLRGSEKIAIAIRDITGLISLREARYFVKTYSSARDERENGLYKDIFFDDLLMDVDSYFKLESINSRIYSSRSGAALINSDMTTLPFSFLAFLPKKMGVPRRILSLGESLSGSLQQEPGLEALTPQRITETLLHFYWLKRLYAWLLRQVRPEYVLVANTVECEITAAAKEQGITVIEFQHGTISRHHPGYSWTTYAVPYKSSMPIPDRIFLFGEHWRQELALHDFWGEELCSVGSVKLDQYRGPRPRGAADEDEVIEIVLTTQGIDVEELVTYVADFLRVADGQMDFRLYIKLHPVYETNKSPYEAAFGAEERVSLLLGSEPPSTFELLTRADVHVSIYSTCHYDALGLGVPTVILPLACHEVVLSLYEAGHAFLAETPRDLLDIVLKARKHKVLDSVRDRYYKPGALENIKKELGILSCS